jgi:hypothetical protein
MTEMTRLIVKVKPGVQGTMIDIEGAFRTIDISLSEYWLGVTGQENLFYFDTAMKFGSKGSSYILKPPADTSARPWRKNWRTSTPRWAYDITLCREPIDDTAPYQYLHNTKDVITTGNDLGFSLSCVNEFS